MLLNLPVTQEIEILLDETMLSRLDLSSLSLANLDSLLPSAPTNGWPSLYLRLPKQI